LLGVAFVAAAFDIADTPPCKDVNAAIDADPGSALANSSECYDGSTARRAGQAVLSGAAGLVAILALIPGLAYAIARRWLVAFGVLAAFSILLAVLYAVLGRVG
jgi:hypothetical protein